MTSKYFIPVIFMLCLSLMAQVSYAQEDGVEPPEFNRVAQSGFQFLHIPVVARNAAMANIKTGLANNGATAAFANPANLVDVDNAEAAFSHMAYVADIAYIAGVVSKNFGRWGVFGVHFASLDAGEMVRTENSFNRELGIVERSGSMGTFTAGNTLLGLSYARSVTNQLSIGANISYVEEQLENVQVDNFKGDFGVFFRTGFRSLRFSLVARNAGPDQQFTGFSEVYGQPEEVKMPVEFFGGIGYDLLGGKENSQHTVQTALEVSHPNDGPERVHTALEYSFSNMLFLRSGYRFNYDEQGLTLGGGLNFEVGGIALRADYAYLDYGRLNNANIFTLGIGM